MAFLPALTISSKMSSQASKQIIRTLVAVEPLLTKLPAIRSRRTITYAGKNAIAGTAGMGSACREIMRCAHLDLRDGIPECVRNDRLEGVAEAEGSRRTLALLTTVLVSPALAADLDYGVLRGYDDDYPGLTLSY
jgi:hypothetical protein